MSSGAASFSGWHIVILTQLEGPLLTCGQHNAEALEEEFTIHSKGKYTENQVHAYCEK